MCVEARERDWWERSRLRKVDNHQPSRLNLTQLVSMSASLITSATSIAELEKSLNDVEVDPNRKYSVFKHRKKQAANESQLLM